jgi:hypothetical protein
MHMAGLDDFNLEDLDDSTACLPAPPAAVGTVPPAGLRRLRRSAALLPPLLILATAGLALAYRVQISDWGGFMPLWRGARRPVARATLRPVQVVPPLVVRLEPPPVFVAPFDPPVIGLVPELTLVGPVPDVAVRRVRATRAAIGFDRPRGPLGIANPPRGQGPPEAEAPPGVLTQKALDAIRAESVRRRAEIARLERIKARQPENDRRRARLIRAEKLERARREAKAARRPFLEGLAEMVRIPGWQRADKIYAHMNANMVEIDQVVADELAKDLMRWEGRINRRERVALFRSHGIPEALILEYLWNKEKRRIPERGGPRDEAEALVLAARQLLAMQPASVRKTSASGQPRAPSRDGARDAQ